MYPIIENNLVGFAEAEKMLVFSTISVYKNKKKIKPYQKNRKN